MPSNAWEVSWATRTGTFGILISGRDVENAHVDRFGSIADVAFYL